MTAGRVCLIGLALTAFVAPARAADFERHVVGVFGKAGCNSGSCHGSFQGKNGFRLSLFGYEPEIDFKSLTRDAGGRRIDTLNPDGSLLLLKATGRIAHEGGVRFGSDTWQYRILREWIGGGARREPGRGTVSGLVIDLPEFVILPRGGSRAIAVSAQFADGSSEDVTRFCDFKAADEAVADVSTSGEVKAGRPGDTALVISYRGAVTAVRVLVPAESAFVEGPVHNDIDREVAAKLRLLNMPPSPPSSDAEFLRRVTIDTIAALPGPEEVRRFLADASPDKRARKIDELLAHPLHAALWATRFSDITGNSVEAAVGVPGNLRTRYAQMWQDWFRKRFRENMPYDQIVRGVMCATSREGSDPEEWVARQTALDEAAEKGFDSAYPERQSLDLFWKGQNMTLEARGERIAAAFLGIRLECAQCHKHPADRWTQSDYRSFANVFAQVQVGASPEARELINKVNAERRERVPKNNQATQLREVFLAAGPSGRDGRPKRMVSPGALRDPATGQPLPPRALGGPEIAPASPSDDCRERLFGWMVQPDNPGFAKVFVNRVWSHYFGIGLVEPADDFSAANPPTNPRLLEALAREFIRHRYDVRHMERLILNSATYQRGSAVLEGNRDDRRNYARSYPRPLMAEAAVDVLNAALGASENFGPDAPAGSRMIEVGSSRVNNGSLAYVLRIFGRPPRTSACDCERSSEPALPQTLFRMSDPAVMQKLAAPSGRLACLVKSDLTDEAAVEDLFLATLSRFPTDREKAAFARHRSAAPSRSAALHDTLWALINTREFALNH